MKQQVKLTESGLYDVIREAVNSLIMEFGSDPGKKGAENREKMAKASKRALKKGDTSVYQNSVNSITKGGGSKEALSDFHKNFETDIEEDSDVEELSGDFNTQPANNLAAEGRQQFKVTESQLKDIIKESVKRILREVGETEDGQEKLGGLAARKSTKGDLKGFYDIEDYAKEKRNGNLKMRDKYAKGFHAEKDRILKNNKKDEA
jgi:hypothetical protein